MLAVIRIRRRPMPLSQSFDRSFMAHSVEVRDLARLRGFVGAKSATYPWTSLLTPHGLIDLYWTR